MANISAIKLPDGNTYDIKDSNSGYITGMTILSYGSSTWDDFIGAYNANKVVYCRASSNANPASGSQTRLAFMAYVNNATTPTNVEFQYYRSVSTHTASQQGDQVFVYKLDKTSGWSVTTREASVKVVAGNGLGGTYSNGTMTLTGPTKVSDLTNDSGFITGYTETDPVFTASAAHGITSSDISNWNSKPAIPYIIGTQTESTNIWTGVAPFSSLETGQAIRYKLPYEGTSSAAKLNLTLSNNTTTGNISIYMSGSYTVKDQYGAGSVIEMTYDGAAWRVSTITTAIRSVTTSISATSTGASKFLNNNYITGGTGGSAIISSVLTTIPASDWTGSSPPYVYNSGALGGFTTQSFIFMDLIPSSTYSQAKLEVAEYSKIYKAECTSQSHITFYATSAPSVDLPIQILYL